ncbi:MAG: class I fructose-bisphosphate aldolase [Egibacteraceae bacterium]
MRGAKLNAGRLFDADSGRSFIAAIDHGLAFGVVRGGEDAEDAMTTVVRDCRPDGVLVAPGLLDRYWELFAHRGAPVPICRLDFVHIADQTRPLGEQHRIVCSPREAAALGAGAVVTYLILGPAQGEMFAGNVAALAGVREEAHALGLPLVVEAVDWGSRAGDEPDPELLTFGCRMAAELGADVIKTEYTGEPETMRPIVDGCPVPVLVLGGPQAETEEALLEDTRDAIGAGAAGVVYGRNVWQADDPVDISQRIREVVHG